MSKKRYDSVRDMPMELVDKLSKYVSNPFGDTFVITGLPPEVTGGVLARYSRAPTGMRETLVNEFLDDDGNPSQQKGTDLMERVLIAFGDDSVGELEGTHLGIENISQVLTKEFEDRRIGGSPIERSTRYVKFDVKNEDGRWNYLRPREILEAGGGLLEKFERVNDRAFEVYSDNIKRLVHYFENVLPRSSFKIDAKRNGEIIKVGENELENDAERKAFDTAYKFTVRCAALDVGRVTLPGSALTQMGLFANGRFYKLLLNHMKSSELAESREKALEVERELNKVIPTFVKNNSANPEISARNKRMRDIASEIFRGITPEEESVTLVSPRASRFDETLAYSLYPYTDISLEQIGRAVEGMSEEAKLHIWDNYVGIRRNRRDRSGRGLEAGYPLVFDILGDFGIYRDLERHRMLTQDRQIISPNHGFFVPAEISEVGLGKEVAEVADMTEDLNSDMRRAGLLVASQYATLFGHRVRFAMGMNLREFQHLSELRTQPAGHYSYRMIVMDMAKKLFEREPWTKRALGFIDNSDPGNKISRAKERAYIAGRETQTGTDSGIDLE